MAKDSTKWIASITGGLAAVSAAVAGFWSSVCPIINACPAEAPTEVAAPAGNTTTTKNVELNGSGTANGGGSATGEVKIDNLSF